MSGAGNQSTCPREGKGRRTIGPLTILKLSASSRLPVAQHPALSGGNTHMQGWGLTTCYETPSLSICLLPPFDIVSLAHNVSFWPQKLTYSVSFWAQKLNHYVSFWIQKTLK